MSERRTSKVPLMVEPTPESIAAAGLGLETGLRHLGLGIQADQLQQILKAVETALAKKST